MSMAIEGTQSSIYTTREDGYMHVAAGSSYAGKIRCYNWLVGFIFWYIGWSEWVNVKPNEKNPNKSHRYLQKVDYATFIRNTTRGNANITENDVEKFTNFRKVQIVPNQNNGLMRGHISRERSDHFFTKMVKSLFCGDFSKATRYAGKGATLDLPFWVREFYGLSFDNYDSNLPADNINCETTQYTPLLYGAERGQRDFCSFLIKLHASQTMQGRSQQFKRTVTSDHSHTDNFIENTYTPHKVLTRYGGRVYFTTVQPNVYTQTTRTITYLDTVVSKFDLSYNREDKSLKKLPSAARIDPKAGICTYRV
jgi:hypothetical protein